MNGLAAIWRAARGVARRGTGREAVAVEALLCLAALVFVSVVAARLGLARGTAEFLRAAGLPELNEAILLFPIFAVFFLYRRARESKEESARARQAEAMARQAEWMARLSEERLRDLLEASSDWVWETGPDHCFTYASDRAADEGKLSSDQFIGKRRWDFADDDSRRDLERHRTDVEAHKPIRDFVHSLTDRTGARRHLRVNGRPIFSQSGEFEGYRGTTTDVTAEVEAQRRATVAQHRLFDAIESMPAAVMVFDADERLALWNSAAGRCFAPLRDVFVAGTPYATLVTETFRRGVVAAAARGDEGWAQRRLENFRGGEAPEIEQLSDGQWLQAVNHKTTDGGTVCVFIDVTELKRKEAGLQR